MGKMIQLIIPFSDISCMRSDFERSYVHFWWTDRKKTGMSRVSLLFILSYYMIHINNSFEMSHFKIASKKPFGLPSRKNCAKVK